VGKSSAEQYFCSYCHELYTDHPTEDWIQCCVCKNGHMKAVHQLTVLILLVIFVHRRHDVRTVDSDYYCLWVCLEKTHHTVWVQIFWTHSFVLYHFNTLLSSGTKWAWHAHFAPEPGQVSHLIQCISLHIAKNKCIIFKLFYGKLYAIDVFLVCQRIFIVWHIKCKILRRNR